jgi:hypothetical protein
MSQTTRKTVISVVIVGVIFVGLLAVATIGGTAYFIYRHVNAEFTPSANAERQFVDARARFSGQTPLIEMSRGGEPTLHRDAIPASQTRKIETLRVLAYDGRAGKLVNVSIPMWLVRFLPSKRMSFLSDNGVDFDSDRVHVTLDDLERRGPGLILDQVDRRGAQVLVWTE